MVNTVVHEALKGLIKDLAQRTVTTCRRSSSMVGGGRRSRRAAFGLQPADHAETHHARDLREAQAPMREWQRLGHPLPVYFTIEELRTRRTYFRLSFTRWQTRVSVLYGHDPFANLNFSDVNLRHQTEYELRSKLIQLRRMYIPASVSVEKLCDLMSDSLVEFCRALSRGLILYGENAPVVKARLRPRHRTRFRSGRRLLLRGSLRLRTTDYLPPDENEANEIFAAYLEQLQHVIEAADEFDRQAHAGELK